MITTVPSKNLQFFPQKYRTVFIQGIFLLISIGTNAQKADVIVPASQVRLIQSIKIHSGRVESPTVVNPNAIYSNVSSPFSGDYVLNNFASVQDGNTITTLIADSLGLVGTPPFVVDSFSFSVVNVNSVAVAARIHIRLYAADGTGGGPGTLIEGLSFNPISFDPATFQIFSTGHLAAPFTISTHAIWAGMFFDDDTATTGATLGEMNNLGQGVLNPIDRGSSTDDFFATDTAGNFLDNNPAGLTFSADENVNSGTAINFIWEIASSGVLPVTLGNFTAQRNGQVNTLTWNTSQELNSNYFAIERSADGIHFNQVGEVKAAGNSSLARSYHFDDTHPGKGINYYRLHMVDIDNIGKYSNIVTVKNTGSLNLTLYPNPAHNTVLVNIDAERSEMAAVSITDINGRKVYNRQVSITQGNNNFPVEINNFSKGTYFIKVQLSTGSYTNKFDKL